MLKPSIMKSIITLFFAFFVATITAQEASFKQFYKANKDKSEFSIGVPNFLKSAFIDTDDAEELEILIKKSRSLKLMVFNNDDNSVANNFKKFVKGNKIKTLVRVKDGKDRAEIYFIERNDYIREIIVKASSSGDELVLLGIKTKLTKDELASIMSSAQDKVASK